MRTRPSGTSTAADFLATPPPAETSPNQSPIESPEKFHFDLSSAFLKTTTTSASKKTIRNGKNKSCANVAIASASVLMQATRSSPHTPSLKSINTISDLKEMTSSRLDSLKRRLDLSNSEILKDIEASQSRLRKRFKIQIQACQQVTDEAEKDYKKMSERITESQKAMKASFAEFIAEAQATASRLCKTSIPELSKSFENAIDALRSRHGIPPTSA